MQQLPTEQTQMHVYPNALAVHENGNIIFTDSTCKNITAVDMEGVRTATFGSGVSVGVDKLVSPCAVAVVPSNLPGAGCFVVADSETNKIVCFYPDGRVKMVFGDLFLKRPRGVVVVPAGVAGAGNILVLSTGNQHIAEFDSAGQFQSVKWKPKNFLPEAMAMIPYGVPGAGNLVIVEAKLTVSRRALSVRGCVLDRDYRCLCSFGSSIPLPGRDIRSSVPVQTYVAVDAVGGLIFTDTRMDRICIFNSEFEIECYMGLSEDFVPGGAAVVPHGLPGAGSVVVADRHGNRILVFDREGVPRVLYPPPRRESSLEDWAEKVDAWMCAVCLQKTRAGEVVACCVKDIEDKTAQATTLDQGQHIHAVCRTCYGQLRKSKAAESEPVICPQCRSSALTCLPLDNLPYSQHTTLTGRMGAGVNPYVVHMPALTQMNFSKELLKSAKYREKVLNSVTGHPIDSHEHMNRLVDRVMRQISHVRNENTDEYKARIKSAFEHALKHSRGENYLPPPTDYFKTLHLKKAEQTPHGKMPHARLELATLGS